MNKAWKQPWINTAGFDSLYILLPPFLSLLIVFLLPDQYKTTAAMPVAAWVALVLLVDVSHVYSTLFRTYFNKERFRQRRFLFTVIPVACYIAGVLVYAVNGLLFWRLLAYLAVYHFIRQQYGFMRLYSRTETASSWMKIIDVITVYAATIYPVIFWHLSPGRNFNWFVDGDFITGESARLLSGCTVIYWLIIAAYFLKEIVFVLRYRYLNQPRNLLIAGTVISWYAGIVYFNGDLAFTLLNVVSHGIPYMALIWVMTRREQNIKPQTGINPLLLRTYGVAVFIGIMVVLAYFEEGLWDGLVWKEHGSVFSVFHVLPQVNNNVWLTLLVPLLSLPQTTHYVLDGFIWRRKDGPV